MDNISNLKKKCPPGYLLWLIKAADVKLKKASPCGKKFFDKILLTTKIIFNSGGMIMEIEYIVNGELDAGDIIEVFQSVGWNKDEKNIVGAFEKSFYILAYDNDQLIGFARAISDNEYYTGVYDVVIKPKYQGQGIGRKMVETIVKKFQGTYIFLTYTEGNRDFYEKCGFKDNNNAMWIQKV